MRISDWSSDVCSSDLRDIGIAPCFLEYGSPTFRYRTLPFFPHALHGVGLSRFLPETKLSGNQNNVFVLEKMCCRLERSEEHTSELQSLMRISYAVFCLKKKNKIQINTQKLYII